MMALATAKLDAAQARIAGLSFDPSGWQGAARTEALTRLLAMGLPSKRDEYWRYTDATTLNTTATQGTAAVTNDTALFDGLDQLRVVFVDGVFDADLSDDLSNEGLSIERLATEKGDIHWARDVYGVLELRGQTPIQRPFAALNAAFATDGVLIRAMGKVSKPVSLIYLSKSNASDVMLHHCIKIDPEASLTLLEQGSPSARFNCVLEADIAESGQFHHVRAQRQGLTDRQITHIFAKIGTGAAFKSFTMTANGALTRNEAVMELVGSDASAHVAGAALGDGAFHHDDTVFVTHSGERCESRQVYKKVLRNGAVGVFQGKILVNQGAQKTDGYQISQALLLDGDSQFLAKPELEIYADDVKCSHGSTSGAIDDTALFYLRSRGVPLAQAQSLLVLAFLAEAIGEIEDEAISDAVRDRLEIWLDGKVA